MMPRSTSVSIHGLFSPGYAEEIRNALKKRSSHRVAILSIVTVVEVLHVGAEGPIRCRGRDTARRRHRHTAKTEEPLNSDQAPRKEISEPYQAAAEVSGQ